MIKSMIYPLLGTLSQVNVRIVLKYDVPMLQVVQKIISAYKNTGHVTLRPVPSAGIYLRHTLQLIM